MARTSYRYETPVHDPDAPRRQGGKARQAADVSANGPSDEPAALPDALLEDAAVWFARLRDVGPDPATADARQAAFERWLRADPRHLRAFEETERLWEALEAPVAQAIEDEPGIVPPGRPRSAPASCFGPLRAAALAACILVFAGAGLTTYDDVLDRLRSDHMTAVGERAPLVLEDGSRVTLNSDTAVAIDMGPAGRQVRLFRGEAWFEVAPDADRPFVVETAQGRIRVTGTHFDVRLDDDTAVVSLAEGAVSLTAAAETATRPSLDLAPGQQARLSRSGISDPAAFDMTAVTAWLRGQLVFYNTPLPQVVAELNRYRSGRIVVASGALESLRISGVFRTDSPDAALTVIADTLPIRVLKLTDYLVLLR